MMNIHDRITKIFDILKAHKPSPQSELHYTNPFTLLVAVVLSAQSTDKHVNKITEKLFQLADDPLSVVQLGEEKLRDVIKSIGFFRVKAKNVFALSQVLLNQFGGQVPNSREALESLPGVGRKTANVVLSVIFGEKTLAVDTHVFRLAHRLGFSTGKTPWIVEQELLSLIPDEYMDHAHHWLILHGRYICKAKKPLCAECPIKNLCPYEPKNI